MAAYVYSVYDARGRLIYVGSTRDVIARMKQHVTDSWWITQSVKVRASVYPDILAARTEEKRRIKEQAPRWNIHFLPPRWTWTQQQYHDYLTAKAKRPDLGHFGRGAHFKRLAAEYRFRFGCDLLIPTELTTAGAA